MEGINKSNIDQWMFDYVENNLDASAKLDFEQFIEANPVYKEELQIWQQSFVSDENITFPDKNTLLKNTGFWHSLYFKTGTILAMVGLLVFTYWWIDERKVEVLKENSSPVEKTIPTQEIVKEELYTDNFEEKNYDFKIVTKPSIKSKKGVDINSKQEKETELLQGLPELEQVEITENIETILAEEKITESREENIKPTEKSITVHKKADKMPRYPGGNIVLFKYFDKHLNYPKQARKNKVEGRVLLKFIVTKTGEVKDITVAKGISASCDEEAVKVLQKSGKWIPGEINGEPVDVMIGVPFEFRLK